MLKYKNLKYKKKANREIKKAIQKMKRGVLKLKDGTKKVTRRKQAIEIGLRKARKQAIKTLQGKRRKR